MNLSFQITFLTAFLAYPMKARPTLIFTLGLTAVTVESLLSAVDTGGGRGTALVVTAEGVKQFSGAERFCLYLI